MFVRCYPPISRTIPMGNFGVVNGAITAICHMSRISGYSADIYRRCIKPRRKNGYQNDQHALKPELSGGCSNLMRLSGGLPQYASTPCDGAVAHCKLLPVISICGDIRSFQLAVIATSSNNPHHRQTYHNMVKGLPISMRLSPEIYNITHSYCYGVLGDRGFTTTYSSRKDYVMCV